MTKVIVDAELLSRLNNLDGLLELCDPTGATLGYFHPVGPTAHPDRASVQSPVSREELERRRQQRAGVPLREILSRLENT